jgi:hypothetical protein
MLIEFITTELNKFIADYKNQGIDIKVDYIEIDEYSMPDVKGIRDINGIPIRINTKFHNRVVSFIANGVTKTISSGSVEAFLEDKIIEGKL